MRAKWSKFEILVTCLSIVITPLAARLTSIVFTLILDPGTLLLTYLSLSTLFLVPLICAALLVRFLKMRSLFSLFLLTSGKKCFIIVITNRGALCQK